MSRQPKSLSELEVGDEVVKQNAYGRGLSIEKVTGISKARTQVSIGSQRFSTKTGKEIGEGYRSADKIYLPTESLYAGGSTYQELYEQETKSRQEAIAKAPFVKFLNEVNYRLLPVETLEAAAKLLGYKE